MYFRLGEIFSGPGGLGWGAKNTDVKKDKESFSISHQWAIDYDKDSCLTSLYRTKNKRKGCNY